MNKLSASEVIGKPIIYQDFLGYDRFGKIGWIDPYDMESEYIDPHEKINFDNDGSIVWCYIVDDDPQYNIHNLEVDTVGNGNQNDIRTIWYAEMRLSVEISLLEE